MSATAITKDFSDSAQGPVRPLLGIDVEGTLFLDNDQYNTGLYKLALALQQKKVCDVVIFSTRPHIHEDGLFIFKRKLTKAGIDPSLLNQGVECKSQYQRGNRVVDVQVDDKTPGEQGMEARVHLDPVGPEVQELLQKLEAEGVEQVSAALQQRLRATMPRVTPMAAAAGVPIVSL